MGVYIKGWGVEDLIDEFGIAIVNRMKEANMLVEVKEPHGRLIDGKALLKDLSKRWDTNDDHDFADKEVWHALEDAPTVIESEGE